MISPGNFERLKNVEDDESAEASVFKIVKMLLELHFC